jgi:tetratricopeptide (TPR) repeat protein
MMPDPRSGSADASLPTPRLSPGAIPDAWKRPAEAATDPLIEAPASGWSALGPVARGGFLVVLAMAAVGIGFALGPKLAGRGDDASSTTTGSTALAPSNAGAPSAPAAPVEAVALPIPPPPPTSSTTPSVAAPEDQGGAPEDAPTAPLPGAGAVAEASAASAPGGDAAFELPARKKARRDTAKGEALLHEGDAEQAKLVLTRAVLSDPTWPEAWRSLAVARAKTGDGDGARQAYRRYVALVPDAPDAAELERTVDAVR